MHLQERKICIICVGKLHQWDYWGSCTRRNLKGLHVIDQKVPASYEPSLFVANGDFPTHEWPHYFQAHVFPAQKTGKNMCSRKIHKYRRVCAQKECTHKHTRRGYGFGGWMFKPLLAPDQTEFPMKFSVEQKWLELIEADKWPKQIALPLWQGSRESN